MKIVLLAALLFIAVQARNVEKRDVGFTPGSWETIGGTEYWISTTKIGIEGARGSCALNQALVKLGDEAKNLMIRDYLSTHGYGGVAYWTDGERDAGSSTWVWKSSANEPFSYVNWNVYAYEPDVATSQRACLALAPSTGWFDSDCNTEIQYICETLWT